MHAPGWSRRALAVAALVVLASTAPGRAWAAGSDSERVRGARAHYEQAVAHYNLDEYAPALAEFREAYRLKPDPSFLFNIAQCHRKLGEREAALDFYRKYLRSLPEAPNRADVERIIGELRELLAGESRPPPAPTVESPPPAATAPRVPEAPPTPAAAPAVAPALLPDLALAYPPPPPAPPPTTPVYRRWWFWTALGAAALGGVAAALALNGGPDPFSGTLAPGVVELRAR